VKIHKPRRDPSFGKLQDVGPGRRGEVATYGLNTAPSNEKPSMVEGPLGRESEDLPCTDGPNGLLGRRLLEKKKKGNFQKHA